MVPLFFLILILLCSLMITTLKKYSDVCKNVCRKMMLHSVLIMQCLLYKVNAILYCLFVI